MTSSQETQYNSLHLNAQHPLHRNPRTRRRCCRLLLHKRLHHLDRRSRVLRTDPQCYHLYKSRRIPWTSLQMLLHGRISRQSHRRPLHDRGQRLLQTHPSSQRGYQHILAVERLGSAFKYLEGRIPRKRRCSRSDTRPRRQRRSRRGTLPTRSKMSTTIMAWTITTTWMAALTKRYQCLARRTSLEAV